MGLSDKFKNLAKQAQDTVAANADKLHDAVDTVGVAVNEQTQGKYARHIQKVGDKAGSAINKVGGATDEAAGADAAPQAAAPSPVDASFAAPSSPASSGPSGSPGFGSESRESPSFAAPAAEPAPGFASDPESPAPQAPAPTSDAFPSFDE